MRYNIIFNFDGYTFNEIVDAENETQAFDYLKWICDSGNDYKLVKITTTEELPAYYCPQGWIRPESREQAMKRSLSQALKLSGVNIKEWSEELDKILKSLGYTAEEKTETDVFGFKTKSITYKKSNAAGLSYEIE